MQTAVTVTATPKITSCSASCGCSEGNGVGEFGIVGKSALTVKLTT